MAGESRAASLQRRLKRAQKKLNQVTELHTLQSCRTRAILSTHFVMCDLCHTVLGGGGRLRVSVSAGAGAEYGGVGSWHVRGVWRVACRAMAYRAVAYCVWASGVWRALSWVSLHAPHCVPPSPHPLHLLVVFRQRVWRWTRTRWLRLPSCRP